MQRQPAYAEVYPASLAFLDAEPEPALHVGLDETTRRDARAELNFVAAFVRLATLALCFDLAFAGFVVSRGSSELVIDAFSAAIGASVLVALWLVASTLWQLAPGEDRVVRLLARVFFTTIGLVGALWLDSGGRWLSSLVCFGLCTPALYVILLSRVLPTYSLTEVVTAQQVGRAPAGSAFLYATKRWRPFVRVAWAVASDATRWSLAHR